MLSRRRFLGCGGAALSAACLPGLAGSSAVAASEERARTIVLEAGAGAIQLDDDGGPPLPVFAYNGMSPGPLLRYRVGDQARVRVLNRLDRPTTVHWHGMRVPNAMDGVPGLTQAPIAPGEEFSYVFTVRDPGTFWYHPHFQSAEQLDRGLAGAIVVESDDAIEVDRDLVWVLDDWRLDRAGEVVESFGSLHDASHAGRLGNLPTVNGRVARPLRVRAGERLRLRLVNVANARIFALEFEGPVPQVIALDGHAVSPRERTRVVLGPSMRVDLVLDCAAGPGASFAIRDTAYPRFAYELTRIEYGAERLRDRPPSTAPALAPATLPEPDLATAARHRLQLAGGAMGGMRDAVLNGRRVGIRELAKQGKVWALNGVVASGHDVPPMLEADHGSSHLITIENESAFAHPMHLHGHPLRVIARNGRALDEPYWRDTVLVAPRERLDVAFVADNPGQWMIHCHIPEHQEAGMMGIVAVT